MRFIVPGEAATTRAAPRAAPNTTGGEEDCGSVGCGGGGGGGGWVATRRWEEKTGSLSPSFLFAERPPEGGERTREGSQRGKFWHAISLVAINLSLEASSAFDRMASLIQEGKINRAIGNDLFRKTTLFWGKQLMHSTFFTYSSIDIDLEILCEAVEKANWLSERKREMREIP